MQMRPSKKHTTVSLRLPILFITLFFFFATGSLPVLAWRSFDGAALTAPMPSRDTRTRTGTRGNTGTARAAELVSATAQGVTVQLHDP